MTDPASLPTPETPYTRAALDVDFSLASSGPEEFQRRVGATIRAFGVCVITNVLASEECDAHCDALCTSLEAMSDFRRRWVFIMPVLVSRPFSTIESALNNNALFYDFVKSDVET